MKRSPIASIARSRRTGGWVRVTAPTPIPHLAQRAAALEPLGWSGADAEWLTLVCLHSGVFTRAQYSYRFDVAPDVAHRFMRRLVAAELATERPHRELRTTARVCHVSAHGLYQTLGVPHIRYRQSGTDAVLFRRLLSLDVVIERPDLSWLATEADTVAHFEELGIQRATLPQRVYSGALARARRYFYFKLPIAVDDREALFVYADPGQKTTCWLHQWGSMHAPLWVQLRERGIAVRVVAATRSPVARVQYEAALAKWRRGERGGDPLTEDERGLLDRIMAALGDDGDERLAEWGGFTAAAKLAGELAVRGGRSAGRRGDPRGLIDSFETHLAERVALGNALARYTLSPPVLHEIAVQCYMRPSAYLSLLPMDRLPRPMLVGSDGTERAWMGETPHFRVSFGTKRGSLVFSILGYVCLICRSGSRGRPGLFGTRGGERRKYGRAGSCRRTVG